MDDLHYDNRFVRELPGDPEEGPRVRSVTRAAWSRVLPTPVRAPRVVAFSREVAEAIGLSDAFMRSARAADVLGGNALAAGMDPFAACYGGHQFGSWANQLGDGRAISLGEVIGADGARHELQLKGAGRTPYSRHADGRAVLRSSLREFLCSEAMHHLGVPTTRALSLVRTGDLVERDMLYDGNPRMEPGAIVCRVAPSFVRFGTFELPARRGDRALLERLVDFTIARDFPHLGGEPPTRRAHWFEQVCVRTARLVADWMRVGFVHGVMNTDNMSVLGLTLDYGPYGWLEPFDPGWTPNTTDAQTRRYRYGAQPAVALWNLARLAEALEPLIPSRVLEAGLEAYRDVFGRTHRDRTAEKLGLARAREGDEALFDELFALLHAAEVDMTLFFRDLARVDPRAPSVEPFAAAFYDPASRARHHDAWLAWLGRYAERVRADEEPDDVRVARMNGANPRFVLRNYLAAEAIERAEAGDESRITELLDVLRRPYDEQPGREAFAAPRPAWARTRPGSSMLSCSS